MKRIISLWLIFLMLAGILPLSVAADGALADFDQKVMNLINDYDVPEEYYNEIVIDTKQNTIQKDDERETSLEKYHIDLGTLASDEPLIPAVPVLETMGKDAVQNETTGDITVTDESGKTTLDLSKLELDDEKAQLQSINNGVATVRVGDGTVKDSVGYFNAEQLQEEIAADMVVTDDEKIIISNPFQTKRLIVNADTFFFDTHGAQAVVRSGNTRVLQYHTEQQAREAYAYFSNKKSVQSVCPDRVMKASMREPNMKTYGKDFLQTDRYIQVLKQKNKTNAVKVAVVDTGVDATHPYLKNRVLKGYDVFSKKASTKDNHMHGTHVSGIIASATPATVKILPVTVLDAGGYGTELTVKAGIDYAIKQKVNIINLSLGGVCTAANCPIKQGIDAAVKAGICVVAAAGNESANTKYFCPAKHSACITVSACDETGALAAYTNYGASVDVCAPGSNIYSCVPGGDYQLESGTSMAAPYAAAAAALLYTANPLLKPARIEQLLKSYCADMLLKGNDAYTGAGLLNLGIALGDKDMPADFFGGISDALINVKLFSRVSPYLYQVSTGREDDRIPTDRSFSTTTSNKKVAYFDGKYIRFVGAGTCDIQVGSSVAMTKSTVNVQKQEVWIDYAASSFAGGNGTAKNPYQIKTAAQLAKFALDMRKGNSFKGKYLKLMNHINLTGKKWISAVCLKKDYTFLESTAYYGYFEGVFDGGNHKIIGMDVFDIPLLSNWFDAEPVNAEWYGENGGFMGHVKGAVIRNLGIENAQCNNKTAGGLLVGDVQENSRITRCYTTGRTMGYGLFTSANNYNTHISECYSAASVYKGGIGATVYSSMQKGGVVLSNVFFCGEMIYNDETEREGCFVSNLYANKKYPYMHLYNCFSTAANENGVGFSYLSENAKIFNCYYLNTNRKGLFKNAGSAVNLKPKALAYFKAKSFYAPANWHKKYLWDFKNVWAINPKVNNGFPYLKNNVPGNSGIAEKTDTWNDYAAEKFAGGNGTKESPFLVATAAQLARISKLYRYGGGKGTYFKLTKDIDLSAHAWLPIGAGKSMNTKSQDFNDAFRRHYFSGNIDGAGHTVSGMHVQAGGDYAGFVARLYFGSIKNLKWSDAFVSANNYYGIVCGENGYYSTILNCSLAGRLGNLDARNDVVYAAAIVGINKCTACIKGCAVTTAPVQSISQNASGVSAFAACNEGEIEQSYLLAQADADTRYTLCQNNTGFIKNCFARCGAVLTVPYTLQAKNYENCFLADYEKYYVTEKLFSQVIVQGVIGADSMSADFAGFAAPVWNIQAEALPELILPAKHTQYVFPDEKWQAAAAFAGGNGTKLNPYQIATAQQLARLREYTPAFNGKYFRLIRNIDLAGKVFNDEDDRMQSVAKFVLDGNHKTISNLIIANSSGLFNFSFSGLIRDVNIKNVQGIGSCALVPVNHGTISGCTVSGLLRSSSHKGDATLAGSICVSNYGVIEKCAVNATIYAAISTGAIAGENAKVIRNCRADGIMVNTYDPSVVGLNNAHQALTAKVEHCILTMNAKTPDAADLEKLDYQTVWNRAQDGGYPTLKGTPHFNIRYMLNGGRTAVNTEFDFTSGSNVILKTAYKDNYCFDGWYRDKALTQKVSMVGQSDKSDVTLYAKWLKIEAPKPKWTSTTNCIKLAWNACENATHYRVYQYNTATRKYTVLADTTRRNYLIKNKAAGTEYVYLVRAYYKDKAGREIINSYSSADQVYTYTLCKTPTVQSVVNQNKVKLKWNRVKGAVSYHIFSFNPATKRYTLLATTAQDAWLFHNVAKGAHHYLVRAVNLRGNVSPFTAKDIVQVRVR